MIHINNNSIDNIHVDKLNMNSVYEQLIKVWSIINKENLQSCFAQGYWVDEYPWTDDYAWKD